MRLISAHVNGLRLVSALLLIFLPIEAVSQSATSNLPKLDLAAEERLQTPLTIEETGIPLEALLQKLSRKNLTLTADRACADLKLQIRLKQRPLYVLMRSLAQLVPGSWEPLPDKSGFRLNMSVKATQRRTRWWQLFLEEREKAKAAQRAYLLNRMRAEPFRRKPGDPNPENSDLAIEAQIAREHEFFRLLPAALQEQIANQQTDCPLYLTGNASFGTEDEEGAVVVPLSSLPPAAQKLAQEHATVILSRGNFPFDLANAVVYFINGGFQLYAGIEIASGQNIGGAFGLHAGLAPTATPLMLNQQIVAMEVRRLGTKASPAWKELADYQESRVWKNDSPPKDRLNHPNYGRAEVLGWLADTTDMEFVADYYGAGFPLPLEVKKKLPVSLKAELDYWAARRDTSWTKRPDNIYLFRNNRWYISDCLQVPAPLLRRWYTMRLEQMRRQAAGPIPLAEKIRQQMDWQAEVVTALTPWQIMGGLRGFFAATLFPNAPAELPSEKLVEASPGITKNLFAGYPFLRDVDRLFSQYNTVRFYAGLDASARNALIEGRLSFSGLNPQQQEQAMDLVPKLRILALQRNNQPVYLQLKPRGEGDFQGESGRVRVTLVLPPSDS